MSIGWPSPGFLVCPATKRDQVARFSGRFSWQISLFGFLLLAFYDLDMLTEGVGIYYHGVPGRLAIANQPGNATVMYRKVKSEDIVGPPQHDAHANTNEKSR